jgi:dihydrofolate reductase
MSKLKLNITMSIDGFVAGPDQSPEHPLGVGGEQLHDWLVPLKVFREGHGEEGGEVNASTPFAEDILGGAGATIMGRNMFGGGPGPWDESWKGWWGDNPPFHHPVFVLTRHSREPLEMQGGTTFHFVTDGIESALEQARTAAGERERCLSGAGRPSRSNTSQPACSTRSSSRSSRSCSEAALGCSKTWEMRSSSRSSRSRRPG